jgi:hydroxyacylglutathione hydrolase
LRKQGVNQEEIKLILLTHSHPDHAGNAAELRQRLGVPIGIHPLEADWVRSGHTIIPTPIRPFGHIIKATTRSEVPPFEPDVLVTDGMNLDKYGVRGKILHTPGHSPGSISLLLTGGEAIVGDLMAGGLILKNRPNRMFLLEDIPLTHSSIQKLLSFNPSQLFFGHGQPANGESVRQRLTIIYRKAA